MNDTRVGHFPPAKRTGLIVHGLILLALAGTMGWAIVNITRSPVGPTFVNFLLVAFLAFAPIPLFIYRAYALVRADYYIDRDSLAILWGLRVEDIPLTDIEWMRPATDLTRPIAFPALRLPGSVLGSRRHPDLGLVEFIASTSRNIILIATSRRVFAISPRDPAALVRTFARATELGSLSPAEPVSVYPSFILVRAWGNRFVRFLWMTGLLLNIGLITWVGILIPSLTQIPLGFDAFGAPNEPTGATRLIVLPLLSLSVFLSGLIAGLYYYRWDKTRPLSMILWVSSAVSAVLFLLAVLFLVTTPL